MSEILDQVVAELAAAAGVPADLIDADRTFAAQGLAADEVRCSRSVVGADGDGGTGSVLGLRHARHSGRSSRQAGIRRRWAGNATWVPSRSAGRGVL